MTGDERDREPFDQDAWETTARQLGQHAAELREAAEREPDGVPELDERAAQAEHARQLLALMLRDMGVEVDAEE